MTARTEDLAMAFEAPWKLFFKSAGVGILFAIALGVLAFSAAPFFDAVGMYFAPARLIAPVMMPIIPSRLIYWLVPDGGPPAAILLILVSATSFWSVLFWRNVLHVD